jgi:two-component system sensor histidine kinase TctE
MARDVLIATLLPQLGLMLLLAGIVYVAVGRGLAPLDALRREIESRSSRDLTPVTEDRAPPEVRRLVHSLNDLLARLTQTLAAQRRFVADAAHQLRTPTAALKTQVEVAQRTRDGGELQARLGQIHVAAERNARLVNQLLSLARAEPGGSEPRAHRPVDIVDIARAETEYWVPQAIARSIDLGFEAGCVRREGRIEVDGDAVMLAEMLGNLIDNALRYTQPGGTVTVSVARASEGGLPRALVAVEDNGPGIPESEREQVFERFHRVLGTGTEGAGLGLAIVREIALAHDGRVDLADGAGGRGARFTVVLPVIERAGDTGAAAGSDREMPRPATGPSPVEAAGAG